MTERPSGSEEPLEVLRGKYLDYCSAQVADLLAHLPDLGVRLGALLAQGSEQLRHVRGTQLVVGVEGPVGGLRVGARWRMHRRGGHHRGDAGRKLISFQRQHHI